MMPPRAARSASSPRDGTRNATTADFVYPRSRVAKHLAMLRTFQDRGDLGRERIEEPLQIGGAAGRSAGIDLAGQGIYPAEPAEDDDRREVRRGERRNHR